MFTLSGAPRTKKNSGRVIQAGGRPRILPSEAFETWNNSVQTQLMLWKLAVGKFETIREPVNCRSLFFRHADVGDAVGFYQALADALEEGGIVENDRLIRRWWGSDLLKDALNPRIEVRLEVLK